MCGIAGIIGSPDSRNIDIIKRMTREMALRGPDDEGIWHQGQVFLGHRRLSIIDIGGGHQPMAVERNGKTHVIVFNGEIYNHSKLKNGLLQQGVVCKTRSDTEVLLRLLMSHDDNISAVNFLTGMFAFAWWDADRNRLVLVRDRLGIKPLYYHHAASGVLSFSSSLESLVCNPDIERVLDLEALEYYFTIGYPLAPLTLYSGIRELPPGHMLIWQDGEINLYKYWQINWANRFKGTEDEAAEHLHSLLDEVIGDHLISDVPVGAFLSGGIDSSAVAARASRQAGPDFQTYTISFPDQSYDESTSARLVAKHLGIRHSVIPMENLPVDDKACRFILKQVGQPFADSSCLPTYLVSKAASEKVKVILSGDGGDELFAGYETFDWGQKISGVQHIPRFLRQFAVAILSGLTPPKFLGERIRQIRKGLSYSLDNRDDMFIHLNSIIDSEELRLLTNVFGQRGPVLSRLRDYLNAGGQLDFITAFSRFLTEISLPGDMLRKVDCMSMAASVEVRVPLLDHRLVEFAQSLPLEMKVKGNIRKAILRRVVKPDLPTEIFENRKWGFSIPLHKVFDRKFLQFCRETLTSGNNYAVRLFGKANIEQILRLNEAEVNPIPHKWSTYTINHVLWMIIQFELWCQDKGIAVH